MNMILSDSVALYACSTVRVYTYENAYDFV